MVAFVTEIGMDLTGFVRDIEMLVYYLVIGIGIEVWASRRGAWTG